MNFLEIHFVYKKSFRPTCSTVCSILLKANDSLSLLVKLFLLSRIKKEIANIDYLSFLFIVIIYN